MTRFRRYAFLGAAVFVGIMVLLPVVQHFRGKFALAAYWRGLVARGERTTAAELKQPIVRTEENGADLLLGGAQLLGGNPYAQLFFPPMAEDLLPGKRIAVAPLDDWAGFVRVGSGGATNLNWGFVAGELALASNSLAQIREALQRRALSFPQSIGSRSGPDWRHLTLVRKATTWLAASAMVNLHAGKREEALADLEGICAVIERQAEPYLAGQMVRDAECANALSAYWQALQSPGWDEAQLARLQRAWESLSFANEMLAALEVERLLVGVEFDMMREDPKLFADRLVKRNKPTFAGTFLDLVGFWIDESGRPGYNLHFRHPLWSFAHSDREQLGDLIMLQTLIDHERAGVTNRNLTLSTAHLVAEQWQMDSIQSPPRGMDPLGTYASVKNLMNTVARAMQCETYREMVVAAIALERFRMRHGRYPESLGALVPEWIAQLPHDYLDGQPLRYRLKPDGHFLLYSVGFDGKDDGGDATPPGSSPGLPTFARGRDLVWPAAATDGEIESYQAKFRKK